jgi:tRNA(Ile)-lysidine synthase
MMARSGDEMRRGRLDPATARIRTATRTALDRAGSHRPVIGVSGGADSMSLAAAVLFLARRGPLAPVCAVIDHGLQPGSAEHTQDVARRLHALGAAEVVTRRVDVGTAGGLEAAARSGRRAALEAIRAAQGGDAILLAHTLDDQAETVLLHLSRGAGPAGLSGMRARRGWLLRPLLGIRRAETVASCAAQGIPVWHDPMNDDPRFARVRVRTRVLPVLETELGPGFAVALARAAGLSAADEDALSGWAADWASTRVRTDAAGTRRLDVAALAALPPAVRHRVLRQIVHDLGGEPVLVHLETIDGLVDHWHGQGAIDLPRVRVRRIGAQLEFSRAAAAPDPAALPRPPACTDD